MLLRLRLKLFVLAMLGLSALFVSVDFLNDFSVLAKFQSFWTASSRIPLWLAAWQMFLDAPLVGLGPGAFSEYYQSYVAALALPDWVVLDSRHMPWVHNLYLEILAERGVLALGIVSLMFVRIIGILLRERKASIESGLLVQACLVSLGLVLVAGFFELSFLRLWFASYFFLMIGTVLFISSEGTEYGIETG
jgi:O-antigen ligase